MRKYLLSETGNFYKANLHCHSIISDGKLSPETLKGAYMANGYSIIAYTDHNALISHNDLTDKRFLALNGFEIDITEPKDTPEVENGVRGRRTCHICLIALDSDNITQPCYNREKHLTAHQNEIGVREKIVFDESKPDHERVYTPEKISEVMKECRGCGFFVTYNHPIWSLEDYECYSRYEGMHAMEICNYGCLVEGYDDYNPKEYDDILRTGKRIFCIATDDNHNGHGFDSPHCDSFGGWIVVHCEKLEYKCVTDALEAGSFYASMGPEIYDLYVEDGYVYVTTSPAHTINYMTGTRHTAYERAHYGESVTKAKFAIKENDRYFRIDVIDDYGRHADTNAVWIDTL